jgi:hypothetical protein
MLEREKDDEGNVFRNMFQITEARKCMLMLYNCFDVRFSDSWGGKRQEFWHFNIRSASVVIQSVLGTCTPTKFTPFKQNLILQHH